MLKAMATPTSTCSCSRDNTALPCAEPASVRWRRYAVANAGSRRPVSAATMATAALRVLLAATSACRRGVASRGAILRWWGVGQSVAMGDS